MKHSKSNRKNWQPFNRQDVQVQKTFIQDTPVYRTAEPRIETIADIALREVEKDLAKANELLQECLMQIEYLQEKFRETGTGNQLIGRLKTYLSKQKKKA